MNNYFETKKNTDIKNHRIRIFFYMLLVDLNAVTIFRLRSEEEVLFVSWWPPTYIIRIYSYFYQTTLSPDLLNFDSKQNYSKSLMWKFGDTTYRK